MDRSAIQRSDREAISDNANPGKGAHTRQPSLRSRTSLLGVAWFTGAVVCLVHCCWHNLRALIMRAFLTPVNDDDLARRINLIRMRLGMKRSVRLMQYGHIQAPIAFGVFRPTIVLSSRFQQCFIVGLIAMGIFAIIRHRIIAGEAGHCLRKTKEAI